MHLMFTEILSELWMAIQCQTVKFFNADFEIVENLTNNNGEVL